MSFIEAVMRREPEPIDRTTTEDVAEQYYCEAFFHDEVIDVLIREVKTRPVLWNSSLPESKSLCERKKAWIDIIIFLDNRFVDLYPKIKKIAVSSMRKRWNILREMYKKYIKNIDTPLKWKETFEQMEFLRPVISNQSEKYSLNTIDVTVTELKKNDIWSSLNDFEVVNALIKEVKKIPQLWDSSSAAYWNVYSKEAKAVQWVSITEVIRNRFNSLCLNTEGLDENVVKQKWASVRMDCCRIMRQTIPAPSTYQSRRLYQELQFLRPVIMSSKQHIQNILEYPADIIDKPLTEFNAEIFYKSVFSDDTFIEFIIGEIEKKPELWDYRLPEFSNEAAWYSLLKALDSSFESLNSKIQKVAVSSLTKTWSKLKCSYIKQIREAGQGRKRSNVESFNEQLQFLKPSMKDQNRHIPEVMRHEPETIDSTTTEEMAEDYYYKAFDNDKVIDALIREVKTRHVLWDTRSLRRCYKVDRAWFDVIKSLDSRFLHFNWTIQRIAVSSMKKRWGRLKSMYTQCVIRKSDKDFRLKDRIEQLEFLSPVILSSREKIPRDNKFNKQLSTSDDIPCSQRGPSAMGLASDEINLNSFNQDFRSLITEFTSRIAETCKTIPDSSGFPLCEYNSPEFSSYGCIRNQFPEDLSSAQTPASMDFRFYGQVSNRFEQDFTPWIPKQFSRTTAPSVQFPSSAISSCAQKSPDILSFQHIPSNFHENISSVQDSSSKSFTSCEQVSNSFEQDSKIWIPEVASRITAPCVQFPTSSFISSCVQNSPRILHNHYAANNFETGASCELEFTLSKTELLGYMPRT